MIGLEPMMVQTYLMYLDLMYPMTRGYTFRYAHYNLERNFSPIENIMKQFIVVVIHLPVHHTSPLSIEGEVGPPPLIFDGFDKFQQF